MITRTRQQYSPHGHAEGVAVDVFIGGRWVSWFTQLTPEVAAKRADELSQRKPRRDVRG